MCERQARIENAISVHPVHFCAHPDKLEALDKDVAWAAMKATVAEKPARSSVESSADIMEQQKAHERTAELSVTLKGAVLVIVKKNQERARYGKVVAEVNLLLASVSLGFNAAGDAAALVITDPICHGMLLKDGMLRGSAMMRNSASKGNTWVFALAGDSDAANQILRDLSAIGCFCAGLSAHYASTLESVSELTPIKGHTRKVKVGRCILREDPHNWYITCDESGQPLEACSTLSVVVHPGDQTGDDSVALKIVSGSAFVTEAAVRREVSLYVEMGEHPNIAQFFGAFDVSSLQSCSGLGGEACWALLHSFTRRSLADEVEDEPMKETKCMQLARSLLKALQHIHAANIVHRGVQPASVFLWPCGRFMLGDFDLAVRVDEKEELARVCGHRSFTAPEVEFGPKEECGIGLDMFAFGALLHYAMSGVMAENEGRKRSFDYSLPETKHISAPCKELIAMTTHHKPKRRAFAGAALDCQWLKGYDNMLSLMGKLPAERSGSPCGARTSAQRKLRRARTIAVGSALEAAALKRNTVDSVVAVSPQPLSAAEPKRFTIDSVVAVSPQHPNGADLEQSTVDSVVALSPEPPSAAADLKVNAAEAVVVLSLEPPSAADLQGNAVGAPSVERRGSSYGTRPVKLQIRRARTIAIGSTNEAADLERDTVDSAVVLSPQPPSAAEREQSTGQAAVALSSESPSAGDPEQRTVDSVFALSPQPSSALDLKGDASEAAVTMSPPSTSAPNLKGNAVDSVVGLSPQPNSTADLKGDVSEVAVALSPQPPGAADTKGNAAEAAAGLPPAPSSAVDLKGNMAEVAVTLSPQPPREERKSTPLEVRSRQVRSST
eukprot:TRINITY_DN63052_c0_g1_i1.p1 TRINITY_DN63052_c0_g1~~TRINITY_DN63052_c0_g1_i1.p1  ORF type:complete len:839 (-),score=111.59 TRINITY_DN63052_c0_g1_i1:162-2678(-)